MTEKERENNGGVGTLAADANVTGQAQAKSPEISKQSEPAKEVSQEVGHAPGHKPKMSEGEEKFNFWTYFGLNYVVNLVSSVAVAFNTIYGSWRPKLDKWISQGTKALHSMGVPLKSAHSNVKVGLESFVLLSGGTILLLPLKYLEDNKRKIVYKLNKKMGVSQIAPDGHEETPEEIHIEKEQPKQSIGNLIFRRVEGTVAVVSSGILMDHLLKDKKTILPKKTYDLGGGVKVAYDKKVMGGKQWFEEKTFGAINKAVKAVNGKGFAKNGIVSGCMKLTILDSFFTAITAVVMKVTNGSKRGKMPKEIDDSHDPVVVRDAVDRITTADEIRDRPFAEKIEKRVNRIIEAKENGVPNKSFVDTIQSTGLQPSGVGV